jgi:hypothetical protein
MQFYVDGTAVGPLQEVGRGFPELRFVTCELRFEVPPGQHTLRVEIVGTDIGAEEDFTVDEAVTEVWGSVRYQNRREQESDEPRLTIDFDGNRVKFAQQRDRAREHGRLFTANFPRD